ncbi:hypothetical protein DUI87_16623 [Hirundo rustica rustica]|uniref:FYVE-type domain-containing protein n=2 Tax=Neognathae TaxID=8825 RepID=A0A3M0KJ03_HIRRU|nr:hypothetical protein DUI87_16623 [Hirundo rustica rustica]
MAAEPQPKALTRKPLLLNKVEGSQEVVNMAAIVPKEDGVISVSEDRSRTLSITVHACEEALMESVQPLCLDPLLLTPVAQESLIRPHHSLLSPGQELNGRVSEVETGQNLVFCPTPEEQSLHCSQACVFRTVRVWLKRDSGQYWPSIYHAMPSPCSCMSFNPETRRLSIGLDNGTISEFILSEDYNKMTLVKSYQAHQSRVIMILFVLEMEWVLSTGQDKHFTWHCSESGQRLGGFDVETRHVFVGDHSGQVTILKLEQESCSLVTTFKGHTGGVTALCWDPIQRVLFSGSSDHSIIMWDIGGRKGTAIELQGHNDKVQSLSYAHHTRQLISCGADGGIVVWNMDVERQETPEWLDSDSCQKCDQPFFWNFKQMWDSKKIGLRQHHCRKCGKAVCGKCSSKRSSIPLMGFEFEVRVCDSCHESITDEERAPTATFHDSKHNIVHVHFDATRGWLLTSGTDKVIKETRCLFPLGMLFITPCACFLMTEVFLAVKAMEDEQVACHISFQLENMYKALLDRGVPCSFGLRPCSVQGGHLTVTETRVHRSEFKLLFSARFLRGQQWHQVWDSSMNCDHTDGVVESAS